MRYLNSELFIDLPIEKVFDFFSKPENLGKVTPKSMAFQIVSPLPLQMKKGTIIDYKIKVMGIPMKWRTEITDWNPPFGFQDTQIRGPYRRWVHTHTFEEAEGGTMMRDHVEYLPPGWIFEPLIHSLIVGPQVKKIFEYRASNFNYIFNEMKND